MEEARKDVKMQNSASKTARDALEAEKGRLGRESVVRSLSRRGSAAQGDSEPVEDEERERNGNGEGENHGSAWKPKRPRVILPTTRQKILSFGNSLKEADLARVAVEQE